MPNAEYLPRWIADLKTGELFERQPDNSYLAAYKLLPLSTDAEKMDRAKALGEARQREKDEQKFAPAGDK